MSKQPLGPVVEHDELLSIKNGSVVGWDPNNTMKSINYKTTVQNTRDLKSELRIITQ